MSKNIMWDGVRKRIKERLDALDLKPTPVSKQAELGASYLAEFLGKRRPGGKRGRPAIEENTNSDEWLPPKKVSIRDEGMRKLAEVLDCDVEYLYGLQDEPRGEPIGEKLPLSGIVASGIAVAPGRQSFNPAPDLGIRALPGFPHDVQSLYFVQDDHAKEIHHPAGSLVVAIPLGVLGRRLRPGDEVIAVARSGDMVERTIRGISTGPKGASPIYPGNDPPMWPDVEIEGVVIFSARYAG